MKKIMSSLAVLALLVQVILPGVVAAEAEPTPVETEVVSLVVESEELSPDVDPEVVPLDILSEADSIEGGG